MNGLSGQTKRDILSFAMTLVIYLSLFIIWNHYTSALTAPLSQPGSNEIALDLSDFVKETQIADIPELEKEEIPEEPEAIKEEEPVKEKSIEEESIEEESTKEESIEKMPIIEEPLPKPAATEKPIEPIPEKPKPAVVKKPKIKKTVHRKSVKKKRQKKRNPAAAQRKKSSSASRHGNKKIHSKKGDSRFVARLRRKINAHKSYPRIARKRGMQGSVRIKFRITSTGKLTGLSASGPRIFLNSAKQAVKSAFPISTRDVSLPITVSLTLNYHLKK